MMRHEHGARPSAAMSAARRRVGRPRLTLAVLLALALASRAFSPPAVAAAAVDVFAAPPTVDLVRLSPDGARLAFVQGHGDLRVVVVQSVADRQILMRSPLGSVSVKTLAWGDEDHVVIGFTSVNRLEGVIRSDSLYAGGGAGGLTSGDSAGVPPMATNPGEWRQALSLNIASRSFSPLLNRRLVSVGPMLNVITDDPAPRAAYGSNWVYLSGVRYVGSTPYYSLFRVSLDGKSTELVDAGAANPAEWLVSSDGKSFLRAEYVIAARRWRLVTGGDHVGSFERATFDAMVDAPRLLGLDTDGAAALVQTAAPSGTMRTLRIQFKGEGPPESADAPELLSAVTDERTGVLQGGTTPTGAPVDLTPEVREARQRLQAAFPGARVSLESASASHRRYVFVVVGAEHGCAYWLVDGAAAPVWIGDRYEGLAREDYAVGAPLDADSQGARAIYTPPVKPQGPAPLVVLFRPRAWVGEPFGVDWLVQSLATAGYGVLEPPEHLHPDAADLASGAATGAFRARDAQSALAAIRQLQATGQADPTRVCAVGEGYGALQALALVLDAPSAARCVAAIGGALDPGSMLDMTLNRGSRGDPMALRYASAFGGATTPLAPGLTALSPYRRLQDLKVPVLLIHGREDGVVDYSQSQGFFRALKKAGVAARLVTLKGADHWLADAASRRATLLDLEGFLGTSLSAQARPGASAAP